MRFLLATVVVSLPSVWSFGFQAPHMGHQSASRSASVSAMVVADMVKSSGREDIGDILPDCPNTIWDDQNINVAEWQAKYKSEKDVACPVEVIASAADNAKGAAYFVERREELEQLLAKHGTIWFRGFDLMKDPEGFRTFWESLALDPCLDPIHSSGLRKFLSKRNGIYEEVNKQVWIRAKTNHSS